MSQCLINIGDDQNAKTGGGANKTYEQGRTNETHKQEGEQTKCMNRGAERTTKIQKQAGWDETNFLERVRDREIRHMKIHYETEKMWMLNFCMRRDQDVTV